MMMIMMVIMMMIMVMIMVMVMMMTTEMIDDRDWGVGDFASTNVLWFRNLDST